MAPKCHSYLGTSKAHTRMWDFFLFLLILLATYPFVFVFSKQLGTQQNVLGAKQRVRGVEKDFGDSQASSLALTTWSQGRSLSSQRPCSLCVK